MSDNDIDTPGLLLRWFLLLVDVNLQVVIGERRHLPVLLDRHSTRWHISKGEAVAASLL